MRIPAPLNCMPTLTGSIRPQAAATPARVLVARNPAVVPRLVAAVAAHRAHMQADAALAAQAGLP